MPNHRIDLKRLARHAMIDRGLWPDFSAKAMAELAQIRAAAVDHGADAQDLRDLLWVSIDNDDSLDLDQITVATEHPDHSVTLLVAIADVDALVPKDSAIDTHARHNTTSVYTSGDIFSMLPERLSHDLTSLREHQDRLAVVVDLAIAANGKVSGASHYRALVRNHAKLAYNSVAAWLTGTGPAPDSISDVPGLDAQLRLQDRVAQQLKARRHQQGALSLETIEPRAVFDGDTLTGITVEQKNRAKELIEDCMIAANQATASYLKRKGIPSFRRILRSPERWQRIVDVAASCGESLPPQPDAQALDAFLVKRRAADPIRFPDLSLAIVKLIGRGEYVLDEGTGGAPEHFGLAVKGYTHSTAPNRRYPDLVTQRLLKAALAGAPLPYRTDELKYLADYCTEKEDDAERVERQMRKSAAALLLQPRIGERFEAIVTGLSEKGTWVRLLEPPVEGKLSGGVMGLDVGNRLTVELVSTNVERGFIDFSRVAS